MANTPEQQAEYDKAQAEHDAEALRTALRHEASNMLREPKK
jgi:hypothetical protein